MRGAVGAVGALAALGALAACDAASPDPGYGAPLQVAGAQFVPGPLAAESGGPDTRSVRTTHSTIVVGELRDTLRLVLAPTATAAIVGLAGADGAWIIPAGPPDVDTPNDATAHAVFGLADHAPLGPFQLVVAASDGDGRVGAPQPIDLIAAPDLPPDGDVVVSLVWTSTADLDLHVVDPLGHEAWSGKPNTYTPPPPGEPMDPLAYLAGGILDRDANAGCRRDGRPREDVVWKPRRDPMGMTVPPSLPVGTYTVRVDTVSMCADASAAWTVAVYRAGALVGAASGLSTPGDVLLPEDVALAHRGGAGVTALQLALP